MSIDNPAEIKLCALTFEVEYVPAFKDDDGDPCNGICDIDDQSIKLNGSIKNHDLLRRTLLHEIVHVMEDYAGMSMKESQVDSFARSLYSFVVDNPGLIAWLVEPKPRRKAKAQTTDPVTP